MKTSMIKYHQSMKHEPLPNCHGGEGALDWTELISPEDTQGRVIKFIHDDIIPPGASVGIHEHPDDEEYYIILSGTGMMTLDDQKFEVGPGDVTAVYPGGSHGLENTGEEPMRIIVVCAGIDSDRRLAVSGW